MPTSTVTDADVLAAIEGPAHLSLRPSPTAPLRSAIARQRAGEPVDDLLDLFRRLLANVLRQRNGYDPEMADRVVGQCERAIRAELES